MEKSPSHIFGQSSLDSMQFSELAKCMVIGLGHLIDESRLWLSPEDYAKVHGISSKSVYRAISSGGLTEVNGGLAPGSSRHKARKRVHRFFDLFLGSIHIPGTPVQQKPIQSSNHK